MQKKIILFSACLSVFFEALDVSAVNLAIPSIQKEIHAGAAHFEWVQSIYLLFYGGFLLLGGRLADIVGRKRIYLFGSTIFLAASFIAISSTSLSFLLVCRALQGLGAAFAIPAAISIITNLYTDRQEINKGLGIFGAFAAIGFASGLMFGGLTVSIWGWKWIFGMNVAIIFPVLLLAVRIIPSDKKATQEKSIDVPGGILLTLFLLVFTFAIHAAGIPSQKKLFLPAVIIAALFFFIFYFLQKNTHNSILDTSLFRKKSIITGNITGILLGASFMSYISLLSVFLLQVVQVSLIRAGLFLFPFSVLSAVVSKWCLPFLQQKYSLKLTANIGLLSMLLGDFFLALCAWSYHWLYLVLSVLFINGISMALAYPTITSLAIQDAEPEDHGMAAGLQSTSYTAGCGIGIAFIWAIIRIQYPEEKIFSPAAIVTGAVLCGWICLMGMIVNSVTKDHFRQYSKKGKS